MPRLTMRERKLLQRLWSRMHILSWQQALLVFALGFSLLITQGGIVDDQLYRPMGQDHGIHVGLVLCLYGLLYAFGLFFNLGSLSFFCAMGTTVLWSWFVYFFITSPLHRIGAVTCGVLALSQVYDVVCWYYYSTLIFSHRERAILHDMRKVLHRIESKHENLIGHINRQEADFPDTFHSLFPKYYEHHGSH